MFLFTSQELDLYSPLQRWEVEDGQSLAGHMRCSLKSLPTLSAKGRPGEGPGHARRVPTPTSGMARAPLSPGKLGSIRTQSLCKEHWGLGPGTLLRVPGAGHGSCNCAHSPVMTGDTGLGCSGCGRKL